MKDLWELLFWSATLVGLLVTAYYWRKARKLKLKGEKGTTLFIWGGYLLVVMAARVFCFGYMEVRDTHAVIFIFITIICVATGVLSFILTKQPFDRLEDLQLQLGKKLREGHYVFIAYSRKDRQYAKAVTDWLRHEGFPFWIDELGIIAGENFHASIEVAIENCDLFMLVGSEASGSSAEVKREYKLAVAGQKKILPVTIDANGAPNLLPGAIQKLHLTFSSDTAESLSEESKSQLERALEKHSIRRKWIGAGE